MLEKYPVTEVKKNKTLQTIKLLPRRLPQHPANRKKDPSETDSQTDY